MSLSLDLNMGKRRRITAHDRVTLQLHPNGTRVQQPGSHDDRSQRVKAFSADDFRGNRIAEDAAGHGRIKQTRRRSKAEGGGEHLDLDASMDAGESYKDDTLVADADDEDRDLDPRTVKRRKFLEDLSFLSSPSSSSSEDGRDFLDELISPGSHSRRLPLSEPSPELLKCIHHLASSYYAEQGLLSEPIARESGKHKKVHGEHLVKNASLGLATRDSLYHLDDTTDEETETEVEENSEQEDDGNEDPEAEISDMAERQNMYKAFDGSALLAIAMLLQEHVSSSLLPLNWEQNSMNDAEDTA